MNYNDALDNETETASVLYVFSPNGMAWLVTRVVPDSARLTVAREPGKLGVHKSQRAALKAARAIAAETGEEVVR